MTDEFFRCMKCKSTQVYVRQPKGKKFLDWKTKEEKIEIVRPAQRVCRKCGFVESLDLNAIMEGADKVSTESSTEDATGNKTDGHEPTPKGEGL